MKLMMHDTAWKKNHFKWCVGSIVKSINFWFKIFLAYQADDNKGTGQSTWRLIQGGQVEDVNLYAWEAYETSQGSNAKGRVKMRHLENHETHLWEMIW